MPYGSGSFGSLEYGGDFGDVIEPAAVAHPGFSFWWWGPGNRQLFVDLINHLDDLKSYPPKDGET